MKEWLASSPFSSVFGIIIVIALVFIALRFFKKVTRPIFIAVLIIGGVLLAFNVIDLAFLSTTGHKFLSFIWDKITGAAKEAATEAITDAISSADLPIINRFML